MYIDATSVGAVDRRFESVVVRVIRAVMHPFEMQIERIRVMVSSKPEGHVCRLYVWAQRGQTVVVEGSASSKLGAIETAADNLRRTLATRGVRGPVAAVPRPRGSEAPVPDTSGDTWLEAASEVGSGIVERQLTPQGPRLLLVLHELDASSACLHWARALASAFGANIEVCRVLPNLPRTDGLPAGKAWLEATRRSLAATRETRRWCAEALPDAQLSERFISSAADLVEQAASLAREREVDWIVMADLKDGGGPLATALARVSGCPVLVARAPTSRSTLLIATDVSEDLHAISSRAAALAEALHAPVLAFHDVGFRAPELSSRVNALTDAWAQIQSERLEAGGHQRLPELEVLLARGTDRVETILQQARREDAELIIVGASAEAAGAAADVPAEVVDRALRSVLVVPSNMPRSASPHGSPTDRDHDGRLSGAGAALERRQWPRAVPRARHASERRRSG